MNLLEHQGLQLFKEVKIASPNGVLLTSSNKEQWNKLLKPYLSQKVVVKAQIRVGKRRKFGGVVITDKPLPAVARLLKESIRGEPVHGVLVEEFIPHDQEWYLSLIVDRNARAHRLIFSDQGGIDIEELANKKPHKIKSIILVKWDSNKVKSIFKNNKNEMVKLSKKIWDCAHRNEAMLVEINPVLVSGKKIIAGDAKVVIDDNSLFRHKPLMKFKPKEISRESEAKNLGLHYVELDGNIGIIGCGAGMVMATLDLVDYFGGKPADFLDVGGGANREKMEQSLEVLTKNKKLKSIFINIFGGITKCDDIARGIVDFLRDHKIKYPVVVRMIGTNEEKGRKILEHFGIHTIDTMEEGARNIISLSKRGKR